MKWGKSIKKSAVASLRHPESGRDKSGKNVQEMFVKHSMTKRY
jgi:hypothetical protein